MQEEEKRKWCAHREEKCSKGRESGTAQRGKGVAKQRMVRRTGKCSKRGR